MRIIFIFNLAYKAPLFFELVDRLYKSGKDVIVYDFISAKKYTPETKEIESVNPFFGAKVILKIKYIRRLFIPFINRKVIEQNFCNDDTVNIHYIHKAYVQYGKLIKKYAAKVVVTFWGSDFLRANDDTLFHYIPLLDECTLITMVEGIQDEFKKKYRGYDHKIKTSFFGLNQLELINKVDVTSIEEFRKKYQLEKDIIFITIGYNASPAQQHILMIEMLNTLNTDLKNKIHVLIPLTYGGNKEYKDRVIHSIESTKISYTSFTNFLEEEELANLRVVSNITVNIQKTDAFSGSLSESIMANNIVLTGDWLPYDIYKEWGVKIFESNLDNFISKLTNILESYEYYYKQLEGNKEKIYNKLSWNRILLRWEELLKVEKNN